MKGRAKCRFRALYDACSVANIPSGVLGTKVNPDTCRISLDGHCIRFEYAGNLDVDVEIFESEKKEFRIIYIYIYIYIYPDTCGVGAVRWLERVFEGQHLPFQV